MCAETFSRILLCLFFTFSSITFAMNENRDHNEKLQFLYDTQNNQMQEQLGFLRLYKTCGRDQPAITRIVWSSDNTYQSLAIDGTPVTIGMLSKLIHSLSALADHTLNELLLGAPLPGLDENGCMRDTDYKDLLSRTEDGYSYINDPSNRALAQNAEYISNHIFSNDDLYEKYFTTDDEIPNEVAFSEWLTKAGLLVELLLLLCHLSSGQPTRGTELLASTIANNGFGGIRSVYWVHKTVCLVQYYNKSSKKYGDKFIARFLPKPIGHLLTAYLTIIRPMER